MYAILLGLMVASVEWLIDYVRLNPNPTSKYLKDAAVVAVSYALLNLLGVT
jgi:diacylglycerol kinase